MSALGQKQTYAPRYQIDVMHHAGVMHFSPDAHIWRFPPANPATEYRHRSAQSESAFDIGQSVRIWRKTGAICRSGIHEVGANRTTSPRLFALLVSRHITCLAFAI